MRQPASAGYIKFYGGLEMKEFTDGVLTVRVGRKYAHVINKAGSEIGVIDVEHFFNHAKDAGFTPVDIDDIPDPPLSLFGLGF